MVDLMGILLGGTPLDSDLNNDIRLDFKNNFLYNSFYSEILNDFNLNCSYINEDEAGVYLASLKNVSLSMIGLNSQSLQAKYFEIRNLIDNLSRGGGCVDIIAISETWIKDFSLFSLQGYNCFGSFRPTGRGGGSALYIKSQITSKKIEHKSFFIPHIIESIATEIIVKGHLKAIIISLYRPNTHNLLSQNDQIDTFFGHLRELLEFLDTFNMPKIIVGDFNLNIFKSTDINDNSSHLLDIFIEYGYIQSVSRATCVTKDSFSLIDNIFTKDLVNSIDKTFVIQSDISDHFPIMTSLNLSNVKKSKPTPPPRRIFNFANKASFERSLLSLSWQSVIEIDNPNLAYNEFHKIFHEIFELHFPLVEQRVNKKYIPMNPFMSRGLLRCRLKKQKLAILQKKNPSQTNTDNYINYRNVYNNLIVTAKKLNYRKLIREAGKNSKKVWSVLKSTMGIAQKDSRINYLNSNQGQINDNQGIANEFNFHFSNIGNNLTPLIPTTNKHFSDYLPPPSQRSFFLFPVNETLMKNTILSIKPKKSCDNNDISMNLLNSVATPISKPLTHIFNQSISLGIFPEELKVSRTIPIFKAGDPSNPDNYRSVFIIDSFSKPMEKIIAQRLRCFLEENNFFYSNQYGFRPKFSTNHAILAFLNFVSKNLNSGNLVLSIFLDIRKCFDMINHEILLKKLENYGIRGVPLQWFKSYFQGRKQQVFCNGINSETLRDILIGVLQGSILGVLLFLIFINDIFMANDDLISFLFADDDNGCVTDPDLETLISKTNIELDKLLQWYNSNLLLIHPGKTKTLLFHPPRTEPKLNKDIHGNFVLPIFLNMNNLNECNVSKISPLRLIPNNEENSAKLLGVQIDVKLNLKPHLKLVHSKISRAIYSLNQMKNLLDKAHLKLLYSSYIKSQIDYCSNIFMLASQASLKPIFLLQKRAIRIICGAGFRDNTLPLFKEEKILPINEIIEYNSLKFMFDYRHNNLPNSFNGTWPLNDDILPYALRNIYDFYREHLIAVYLKNHPLYYFPNLWNSKLRELENETNIDFKSIDSRKIFLSDLFDALIDNLEF